MPNYSLTVTPTFTPFTFQELYAPVAIAQQRHDATMEQYAKLAEDAAEWGDQLNPEVDTEAYKAYRNLWSSIANKAGDLASHGLNPMSFRDLMAERARAKGFIAATKNAWDARKENQTLLRNARVQDESFYPEYDIMSGPGSSLDNWMRNPAYSWGKSFKGSTVTKQVADQLTALSKALANYGNGKSLDSVTRTLITQYGITPEMAAQLHAAYQADPEGVARNTLIPMVMGNVVDTAVGDDWNPETRDEARKEAWRYAEMGINNAIGTSTVQPYTDYAAKSALDYYYWKKQQDYKIDHPTPTKSNSTSGNGSTPQEFKWETRPLVSQNPDRIKTNYIKYGKYFDPDGRGNMVLGKKGHKLLEYMRKYRNGIIDETDFKKAGLSIADAMDFYNFVTDENGLNFKTQSNNSAFGKGVALQPHVIGQAYNALLKNEQKTADTVVTSGYEVPVEDKNAGRRIINRLTSRSSNGDLDVVEFDPRTNRFVKKDKLKLEDIEDEKMTVTSMIGTEYGSVAIVKGKNKKYMVEIPGSMNDVKLANEHFKAAASYNRALRKGKVPLDNGNNMPVYDERTGNVIYSDVDMDDAAWDVYSGREESAVQSGIDALMGLSVVNTTQPVNGYVGSPFEDHRLYDEAFDMFMNKLDQMDLDSQED